MMAFFDSLIQKEIEAWDSVTDGTVTSDSESEVHVHSSHPWLIAGVIRNVFRRIIVHGICYCTIPLMSTTSRNRNPIELLS